MAQQSRNSNRRAIERRTVNVALWVMASWFVLIALGLVVMRVQGLIVDTEFYLGLGAVALMAPVGILIAWRAGEGAAAGDEEATQAKS